MTEGDQPLKLTIGHAVKLGFSFLKQQTRSGKFYYGSFVNPPRSIIPGGPTVHLEIDRIWLDSANDDDVVALFDVDHRYFVSMEMTFAKRYDYLPSKTRYFIRELNDVLLGETKTTWKKHGDLWLPSTIRATTYMPNREACSLIHKLALHWKLGDEVPDDLIEKDAKDWRIPAFDLFADISIKQNKDP